MSKSVARASCKRCGGPAPDGDRGRIGDAAGVKRDRFCDVAQIPGPFQGRVCNVEQVPGSFEDMICVVGRICYVGQIPGTSQGQEWRRGWGCQAAGSVTKLHQILYMKSTYIRICR